MHGVVMWNQEALFNKSSNELNYSVISDQYDWTDGRCNLEFLYKLPTPSSYLDKLSSGYGCATLFWLAKKNDPKFLSRFNRSGTIMDLFSVVLCRLMNTCISLHNAHSWGYFDPETESWNVDL